MNFGRSVGSIAHLCLFSYTTVPVVYTIVVLNLTCNPVSGMQQLTLCTMVLVLNLSTHMFECADVCTKFSTRTPGTHTISVNAN